VEAVNRRMKGRAGQAGGGAWPPGVMRPAGIRPQTGYAKRKHKRGGAPWLVASNHLQRQFNVEEPNRVW
jgi:hypothetical protein